jgi:hypothetical protein
VDDVGKHWELLLAKEGMPSELRMLTQTHSREGHNDGLVCVSMSDRLHEQQRVAHTYSGVKEWAMLANVKHHGKTTPIQELPIANHWRQFSSAIWESGVTGNNLDFLLDYAEHGFRSRSCRRYGIDVKFGQRLIDFIWESVNNG